MSNFNRVILLGRLTRSPELKYSPKGTAIAEISIAINRKWKSETGEDKDEAVFADAKAYGKTAEVIGKYFQKGDPIMVEGRLVNENWTGKDGVARSRTLVVCERFEFVGGRKDQSPAEEKPKTNLQKDMEDPESPVPF